MTSETEVITLPVAAAKLLDARRKSGEAAPSSRSELLYEVRGAEESTAFERVVALASHRDFSRLEADGRLRLDGYPEACRSAALDRAVRSGIIDDRRFAETFVRSKLDCGWGVRRISRELERRGVDPTGIDELNARVDDVEGERERAYEIAAGRHLPERNAYPKTVRFLVGRGFSPSIAGDVARQIISEHEVE